MIAHQDVLDAAANEHFGFSDFLHALANRAVSDLPQGYGRAFVRLRMRPHAYAGGFGKVGHLDDVALERIEIDDEGRSLDVGNERANLGKWAGSSDVLND